MDQLQSDDMQSAWENLCDIRRLSRMLNDSEGVDEDLVDPEKTPAENGLSSLDFVRVVMAMQHHEDATGRDAEITENFIDRPLRECASIASLENLIRTEPIQHYRITDLTEEFTHEAKRLVADRFMETAELERYSVDFGADDYQPFLDAAWPVLTKKSMSFAVVDEQKRLRAVALCSDYVLLEGVEASDQLHPHLHNVFACLSDATTQALDSINEKIHLGEYIEIFMIATASDTSGMENVGLVYLVEQEVIGRAKISGYRGVLAQNTNPVTQKISELLGYRCLHRCVPRRFVNSRGEQPFGEAPDTFVINVDVYSVTDSRADVK